MTTLVIVGKTGWTSFNRQLGLDEGYSLNKFQTWHNVWHNVTMDITGVICKYAQNPVVTTSFIFILGMAVLMGILDSKKTKGECLHV